MPGCNLLPASEHLDSRGVARRAADAAVTREEGRFEDLGQCDVRGVVGGEIFPECPHPRDQNVVGVAFERQARQIFQSLAGAVRSHLIYANESAQSVGPPRQQKAKGVFTLFEPARSV